VGVRYEFNNEDAHHAIKVLRLSPGERFNLGDGKGAWSRVVIENVNKKSMTVKVLESGFQEALPTHFTIVQAIPKGDRIKESIELSTEGGADRIVMWKSARSIGRSEDKIEKLQNTAREASKQQLSMKLLNQISHSSFTRAPRCDSLK
jgi:16S rRNA (uracil1498-N3)-methyltransferase